MDVRGLPDLCCGQCDANLGLVVVKSNVFRSAQVSLHVDQNAACLLEITQRKADAFIYDQLSILKMQAAQPEATRALLKPLQSESWAMALTKENSALRDSINAFLREFRASGGFEKLAAQYLREDRGAELFPDEGLRVNREG